MWRHRTPRRFHYPRMVQRRSSKQVSHTLLFLCAAHAVPRRIVAGHRTRTEATSAFARSPCIASWLCCTGCRAPTAGRRSRKSSLIKASIKSYRCLGIKQKYGCHRELGIRYSDGWAHSSVAQCRWQGSPIFYSVNQRERRRKTHQTCQPGNRKSKQAPAKAKVYNSDHPARRCFNLSTPQLLRRFVTRAIRYQVSTLVCAAAEQ